MLHVACVEHKIILFSLRSFLSSTHKKETKIKSIQWFHTHTHTYAHAIPNDWVGVVSVYICVFSVHCSLFKNVLWSYVICVWVRIGVVIKFNELYRQSHFIRILYGIYKYMFFFLSIYRSTSSSLFAFAIRLLSIHLII